MAKLLWFFEQPGRIEAGPVFGHIYDGVLFVYAYGVSENMPEMLFFRKWEDTPEAARAFLERFALDSLKAAVYTAPRKLRPTDDGPDFTIFGG